MSQELEQVEIIKQESKQLRGTIAETLKTDSDGFEEEDKQLLKFHGLYQQKLRGNDIPPEKKIFTFMIRGRIPGGRLSSEQYLVWDELADKYAGSAIRLTTRQSLQLHGLLKGNLKSVMQTLHSISQSSMGACGDVVRNVTQAMNPLGKKRLFQLDEVAETLSDHFKYKTRAYAEIWLDEEELKLETEEPIYGKSYLPRKFKIAVTEVGDNTIDIYTNDMAFAASYSPDETIDGFHVFAGGGLGMTHKKPQTFPRKADYIGWIQKKDLLSVSEAIVKVHRDYGDRTNRKHARLKYVLHDKGLNWFRTEVENQSGVKFEQKELPAWNSPSYLGWQESENGTYSLGFHILSGRIKDFPNIPLKTTLKEIISEYKLDVQVSPDQDLLLLNIPKQAKVKIEDYLQKKNVNPYSPSPLHDRALACPALPTCSLALTESERFLPEVLENVNALLEKHSLKKRAPLLRMTGCPNGCARPYTAEIGLVGQQSGGKYAVFIGGDAEGTRIATQIAEKANLESIKEILDKLFSEWKASGIKDERFGNFINRIGFEKVTTLLG